MRRLAIIPVAAALLSLAACDAATVQEKARQICGFEPLAEVAAKILAGSVPGITAADEAAKAICAAVAPGGKRALLRRPPVVKGVVVKGRFVR